MQLQIVLEKSSLYLVANTFLPLQNASCTCCLPISCLIYLICVSTLVGLLYVCPCASRLCNCILRGLFMSKYLYYFPWGWDWLYVLATSSLYPPSFPQSQCVVLVHFPSHLISTLWWFPQYSFECIIGFWWPHFFSFILDCLCSVTHIFVSSLTSTWITDERLSVDKLVTTRNGRRHLTLWIICVGTEQLMNTWGFEQTGSASTQSSAVNADRGAVAVGDGGSLGGTATLLGFKAHSSGTCCGWMEVLVVVLEPKVMLASKGTVVYVQ